MQPPDTCRIHVSSDVIKIHPRYIVRYIVRYMYLKCIRRGIHTGYMRDTSGIHHERHVSQMYAERYVSEVQDTCATRSPHKYNGLYGPGYISVMTPGDPFYPPLPTHRTPLFRRGSSGGCRKHPPRGGFFIAFHGPPPDGNSTPLGSVTRAFRIPPSQRREMVW